MIGLALAAQFHRSPRSLLTFRGGVREPCSLAEGVVEWQTPCAGNFISRERRDVRHPRVVLPEYPVEHRRQALVRDRHLGCTGHPRQVGPAVGCRSEPVEVLAQVRYLRRCSRSILQMTAATMEQVITARARPGGPCQQQDDGQRCCEAPVHALWFSRRWLRRPCPPLALACSDRHGCWTQSTTGYCWIWTGSTRGGHLRNDDSHSARRLTCRSSRYRR